MNMLKIRLVFIILIFQVVTAAYSDENYDDESVEKYVDVEEDYDFGSKIRKSAKSYENDFIEKDDDGGELYGYRSKSKKTNYDESNSSDEKSSTDKCSGGMINCSSNKRPQPNEGDSNKSPSDKCGGSRMNCPSRKIPQPNDDEPNNSGDKSSSDKCGREKSNCPSITSSQGRGNNNRNNIMQGGTCNKCGIAYGGQESGRVINGRPVKPVFKYPWIVPLIKNNKMVCGGALISASYVMTAGHCVFNLRMLRHPNCQKPGPPSICYFKPNMFKVRILGSKQQGLFNQPTSLALKRIIGHPKLYLKKIMFDIALLELEKPVDCGATVMPVCLPPRDFHRIGTKLTTAGWGLNTPEGQVGPQMLREGAVKEIEPRRCLRKNQPADFYAKLVCAAGLESGQSSCYGDSGSALFGKFESKFYAVGVVSYGYHQKCSANNPVAYHRVYTALNFIKQHVKDLPKD